MNISFFLVAATLPPRRYYLAPTPKLKRLFIGMPERPREKPKTTRFRIVKYKVKGQTIVKPKICKPRSVTRGRSDRREHGELQVEVANAAENSLTVQSQAICLSQFQYVPMIFSLVV